MVAEVVSLFFLPSSFFPPIWLSAHFLPVPHSDFFLWYFFFFTYAAFSINCVFILFNVLTSASIAITWQDCAINFMSFYIYVLRYPSTLAYVASIWISFHQQWNHYIHTFSYTLFSMLRVTIYFTSEVARYLMLGAHCTNYTVYIHIKCYFVGFMLSNSMGSHGM